MAFVKKIDYLLIETGLNDPVNETLSSLTFHIDRQFFYPQFSLRTNS